MPRTPLGWRGYKRRLVDLIDEQPPSVADGTHEGRLAGFSWRRMHCNWCPWEGARFMLIEHWLEVHDGRTDMSKDMDGHPDYEDDWEEVVLGIFEVR